VVTKPGPKGEGDAGDKKPTAEEAAAAEAAATAAAEAAAAAAAKKGKEGEGGDDDKGGAGDGDTDADLAEIAGDDTELLAKLTAYRDKIKAEAAEAGGEDWRVAMAGGDEKLLARLKRYASPADAGRGLAAAEAAARAKGGVQIPGDDAKPEDVAKFYTDQMGRPEKLEDLKVEPTLPDGEELTDDERNIVAGVMGALWQSGNFGTKTGQFQSAAQIVVDMLVGGRAEMAKRMGAAADTTKKALAKAWGAGDVDKNLKLANAYAGQLCTAAGVDAAALGNLVLQDGTRLGDNELYARAMAVGGRDAGEDLVLIPDDDGGRTAEQLEEDYSKELALANGSAVEKKEYDSAAGKERRAKMLSRLKKAGGSPNRAAALAAKASKGGKGGNAKEGTGRKA
jgi:hypothetical protein